MVRIAKNARRGLPATAVQIVARVSADLFDWERNFPVFLLVERRLFSRLEKRDKLGRDY